MSVSPFLHAAVHKGLQSYKMDAFEFKPVTDFYPIIDQNLEDGIGNEEEEEDFNMSPLDQNKLKRDRTNSVDSKLNRSIPLIQESQLKMSIRQTIERIS
jgi:hypothetical protein